MEAWASLEHTIASIAGAGERNVGDGVGCMAGGGEPRRDSSGTSRSEGVRVVVGFSPRCRHVHPPRVASATLDDVSISHRFQPSRRDEVNRGPDPWAEAHGYLQLVAPRRTARRCARTRRGARDAAVRVPRAFRDVHEGVRRGRHGSRGGLHAAVKGRGGIPGNTNGVIKP